MPNSSLAALAILTLLSVEPCQAQAYQTQDSSGVAVVMTGPAPGAPLWSIGDEPLVTIGKLDGEDPYLFTQIWDALRTPDGRIVVVEGSTYEIRVFGPQGQHQATFGGRGDGPKEFGGPPWIALAGPDTLLVWDPGHYRLSRYDLAGGLLAQNTIRSTVDSLGIGQFPNGLVWQIVGDGTLLWTGPSRSWRMGEGATNSMRRFILLPSDQEGVHDFGPYVNGRVHYVERTGGGFSGMYDPFAPSHTVALGPAPDRVAISNAERWEIQVFDGAGKLRQVWRGRFRRTPVTPTMRATARRAYTGMASRLGLTLRQAEKAFDAMPTRDSVPAIGVMMWDAPGNVWIGEREGEPRDIGDYQVLNKHGRWLSTVTVPEGLGQIFEIGEDYLLVEARDTYGVQYLREYRIHKPAR